MIKTVSLTADTETKVEISGGYNVGVINRTTGMLYASRNSGVVAGADDVAAIPAGDSYVIRAADDTVYLLATAAGDVQLESLGAKEVFKVAAARSSSGGGEGGTVDEVARQAIETHANNEKIHVTDNNTAYMRRKLNVHPACVVGNIGNTAAENGWYKICDIPLSMWGTRAITLRISPSNATNNNFAEYTVTLHTRSTNSVTYAPYIYFDPLDYGLKKHLDKLYVVQNDNSYSDTLELWYNNAAAYSEIMVSVVNIAARGNIQGDGFELVSMNSDNTSHASYTDGKTAYCFADNLAASSINRQLGVDIHALDNAGLYEVFGTAQSPLVNSPTTETDTLYVLVMRSDYDNKRVLAWSLSDDLAQYTCACIGGVWTSWEESVSKSDFNALAARVEALENAN